MSLVTAVTTHNLFLLLFYLTMSSYRVHSIRMIRTTIPSALAMSLMMSLMSRRKMLVDQY